MTRDQAKSFLEENQVKFVLAQFVDIHGVAKTKSVPVSHFEDILNDGAGFAGFAVWGLGQEPHEAAVALVISGISLPPVLLVISCAFDVLQQLPLPSR